MSYIEAYFMKNPATKSRVPSASQNEPLTSTGKTTGSLLARLLAFSLLVAEDSPGVIFEFMLRDVETKAIEGSIVSISN